MVAYGALARKISKSGSPVKAIPSNNPKPLVTKAEPVKPADGKPGDVKPADKKASDPKVTDAAPKAPKVAAAQK